MAEKMKNPRKTEIRKFEEQLRGEREKKEEEEGSKGPNWNSKKIKNPRILASIEQVFYRRPY